MKESAEEIAKIIKQGGVILYPTDTIWGLGCDPMNAEAIAKIDRIKQRLTGKSYLLLVNSQRLLNYHVAKIPEVCFDLLDFATKPLTIIYPNGKHVDPSVLAEDGSLGIRMISQPVYLSAVINKLKHGLISTSANISGEAFPANFSEMPERIKKEVDYIVDPSLENTDTQPSQIIKIGANSEVTIIRK